MNLREKMTPFYCVPTPLLHLFFFLLFSFSPFFGRGFSPTAMASISVPPGYILDTVEEACQMAWKNRPQYASCAAALGSAPGSRNATLPNLAVLSTSLSLRDASTVVKRMQEVQSRGGPAAAQRLAHCLSHYRRTISTMGYSTQEIRVGHYGAAGYSLASAMEDTECVDGVGDESAKEQYKEMTILVGVTRAICYKYCRGTAEKPNDCFF